MIKYVMLLRGVNVGGKNKLSMKELKVILENNGFINVFTYINSGNIIFSHSNPDMIDLKKISEKIIEKEFGLRIGVLIISAKDFINALENAPEWWGVDNESKHNALFIMPPASKEKMFEEVGDIKPEYEKLGHHGNVIFWSAPILTFSRTRYSGIVGKAAYEYITIRNYNTTMKLKELIHQ